MSAAKIAYMIVGPNGLLVVNPAVLSAQALARLEAALATGELATKI